ncbi:MAG: MBL fold metallo-hydrolase [Dehalococcoidales bacterium]|nr:MBL fold metallo-hydrolase [Dehalococcoidales bacterium]
MAIKITTLSENTASAPDLLAEWGFSVLVEIDSLTVLLDTGLSSTVVHNAGILGIDLKKVDRIILSHGHYDHTGGLQNVLRLMRKKMEIIAHPDVWGEKYARQNETTYRYIGIPFQRPVLESLGASFTLSRDPVRITNDVLTTGEVPEITEYEQIEPNRFFVKEDGELKPDTLPDDLALIINTKPGLVVILGCGHRGLINTLRHAQKLTRRQEIRMVIGGCHLIGTSTERVRLTLAALKEMDVQKIGASHCTGLPAAAIMAQELGDRFFFNNAGTRLTLD